MDPKKDLKKFEKQVLGSDPHDIEEFHHRFQFIRSLGEGGFGYVVAARYRNMENRVVAVKVIKKRSDAEHKIRAYKWEYKLLSRLRHPNILKNIDCLETGNFVYIVLELMKGGNLRQLIKTYKKRGKDLDQDTMREIVVSLLKGVEYLHSKQIIHRDLKPDNILFVKEASAFGRLKIADFGLAYLNDGSSGMSPLYQKCGTKTYMAPEMFKKQSYYTRQVDSWSIGVIIYDLITKGLRLLKLPLSEDEEDIENEIRSKIGALKISEHLKDLMLRLLAPNPNYRYPVRLALQHPWVTQIEGPPPFLLSEKEGIFFASKGLKKLFRYLMVSQYLQKIEKEAIKDSEKLQQQQQQKKRRKKSSPHQPQNSNPNKDQAFIQGGSGLQKSQNRQSFQKERERSRKLKAKRSKTYHAAYRNKYGIQNHPNYRRNKEESPSINRAREGWQQTAESKTLKKQVTKMRKIEISTPPFDSSNTNKRTSNENHYLPEIRLKKSKTGHFHSSLTNTINLQHKKGEIYSRSSSIRSHLLYKNIRNKNLKKPYHFKHNDIQSRKKDISSFEPDPPLKDGQTLINADTKEINPFNGGNHLNSFDGSGIERYSVEISKGDDGDYKKRGSESPEKLKEGSPNKLKRQFNHSDRIKIFNYSKSKRRDSQKEKNSLYTSTLSRNKSQDRKRIDFSKEIEHHLHNLYSNKITKKRANDINTPKINSSRDAGTRSGRTTPFTDKCIQQTVDHRKNIKNERRKIQKIEQQQQQKKLAFSVGLQESTTSIVDYDDSQVANLQEDQNPKIIKSQLFGSRKSKISGKQMYNVKGHIQPKSLNTYRELLKKRKISKENQGGDKQSNHVFEREQSFNCRQLSIRNFIRFVRGFQLSPRKSR